MTVIVSDSSAQPATYNRDQLNDLSTGAVVEDIDGDVFLVARRQYLDEAHLIRVDGVYALYDGPVSYPVKLSSRTVTFAN